MKGEILDKPGAEPGRAILRVTFSEDDAARPTGGEFSLAIKEIPSQIFFQYAGPVYWPENGAEDYFPAPGNFDGQALTLEIELEPWIIGSFKRELYIFHLKDSSGSVFPLPLSIGHLGRPSTLDSSIKVGSSGPPARPPGAAPAGESPPPENPADTEGAAALPPLPQSLEAEKPKRFRKVMALIAAALVILLGLGAWLFLKDRLPGTTFSPTAAESPEAGGGSLPLPTAGGAVSPLEEVRELFRQGSEPAAMRAALDRLDGQDGAEDAVFLLLKALAPHSPENRSRYAAFLDPTDTRPAGSIKKNPEAAYDEYELAKKGGDKSAALAQARLLKWAEEQSAKGDPEAARLWQLQGKKE